jgi:uncharacterized RDD family membrane protein YckC
VLLAIALIIGEPSGDALTGLAAFAGIIVVVCALPFLWERLMPGSTTLMMTPQENAATLAGPLQRLLEAVHPAVEGNAEG